MGTKYPFGESPFYPPRDWTCPGCDKQHSKPHFAWPGQVDDNLPHGSYGRVKFNRANKSGSDDLDYSQTIKKEFIGKQAPMILTDGTIQGLFCPHCGWKEELINLVPTSDTFEKIGWRSITKPDCCIKDCPDKAKFTNDKLHFCKKHYELVKE